MKDFLLGTYAQTLNMAKTLVADVPCERFAELPFPGAKHPGWVLSHLSIGGAMGDAFLREPENPTPAMEGVPMEWMQSAMGEPEGNRDAFAKKEEIIAALERTHASFSERFAAASDDVLAMPNPSPGFREVFPTIGSGAFYLLGYHEGYHLGQLQQWRRAAGFPAG